MSHLGSAVVGAIVGGVLAIVAAGFGGLISAFGTAAVAQFSFGQVSGAACLDWQAWVLDRSAEGLTAEEITSLTMLAVKGGTLVTTETEALTGNSTEAPKIRRTETPYFYVCNTTDEVQISKLVGDVRATMKRGSTPVPPLPSKSPSIP